MDPCSRGGRSPPNADLWRIVEKKKGGARSGFIIGAHRGNRTGSLPAWTQQTLARRLEHDRPCTRLTTQKHKGPR